MGFRLLVTGSRDWTDEAWVRRVLADYAAKIGPELEIAHGNCRGADRIADRAAFALGIRTTSYPAKWRDETGTYNPRAGLERNIAMLDHYKPDQVVAFWKNGSTGTQHTMLQAAKRGIYVDVHQDLEGLLC